MQTESLINYSLQALFFPPGVQILILLLAWRLAARRPKLARGIAALALASLYALSMPWLANRLMDGLQPYAALSVHKLQAPADSAIVILAGGRRERAVEYGGVDTVSTYSLERLRYGAWLARRLKLPVLLSGGTVFGEATPEAVLMNQTLADEFGIAPRWLETESRNTAENARLSAQKLKAERIGHAYLVSHAWHLPRAVPEFEKQGLAVTPAPLAFVSDSELNHGPLPYLPSAAALHVSRLALHEWVGRLWYRLRY
ncbi:MAG: YdcF family protein [Gammaproteobacteria bacterium]|nr:YdcF family protein [Gammaproteobacteria bacterium]